MFQNINPQPTPPESTLQLSPSILRVSLPISDGFPVNNGGRESTLRVEHMRPGTYCTNNDTTAFVTPSGELHVSPWYLGLNQALSEAGYSQSSFFVPLSNGEVPANPSIREKWIEIVKTTKGIRHAERIDSWERAYAAEAASRGIEQGLGQSMDFSQKILKYDGIEFTNGGAKIHVGPTAYDNVGHEPPRLNSVGRYSTNNGLAAFVDEMGELFVVAATRDNLATIRGTGYEEGGVFVPFSNGEAPVNWRDINTLKSMRSQPYT
jgi:hypothetical protein